MLSKMSVSNLSVNKSSKEPPDLVKNCQGGCGGKGDSSRKSSDINCSGLRDQPCLHGAQHVPKNASPLSTCNLFMSINIMVTARGFCYTAIPNKCSLVLMISCSFNFAARHQAGQEPSAFPSMHFSITNCWPGKNKLESLPETSLALRSVCTQTPEEILPTQIVEGLTKRHHPLEAVGGGQQGPFSWGSSFHSSPAQVVHTELLNQFIPAPCPTSHCINPSPVQWALGPQRALCCPSLPQGDHSPVLGLATSQNWRVLRGRPHISECWVQHTQQAQHLHTLHPWCWNKTPCTFDRNKNSKLVPRAQYCSCSLRTSLKVWALQVINIIYLKKSLLLHIQYTLT